MGDTHGLVCKLDGERSPFNVDGGYRYDQLRNLVAAWPLIRALYEHPHYGNGFTIEAGDGPGFFNNAYFGDFVSYMRRHEGHEFWGSTYGEPRYDLLTDEPPADEKAEARRLDALALVWTQVIRELGPEISSRVEAALSEP